MLYWKQLASLPPSDAPPDVKRSRPMGQACNGRQRGLFGAWHLDGHADIDGCPGS